MNVRGFFPLTVSRGLLSRRDEDPYRSLQQEMNRVLDSFWRGTEVPAGFATQAQTAVVPRLDVSETENEITVTAELPGIDEKDVEVTLDDDVLTIKGEKREEKEEKDKSYHLIERSYGAFQRSIPIDAEVQGDKIDATFSKGVLTVVLPKSPAAQNKTRKVAIKSK
jgi:HSP20 family protein